MSANERAYQVGVTAIVVAPALASNVQFTAPRGMLGGWLKINAGGGTLALVNASGASTTSGYLVGGSEAFRVNGPATFFLAASGATMTVAIAMEYSAGFSSPL